MSAPLHFLQCVSGRRLHSKTSQPVLQQIEYSNLVDSDTQALLSKLLQDAGVSDLRIQTFFDHVQKFNNAVDPAWLTTGFENAKPSDLKYDPYSMQDAWTENMTPSPAGTVGLPLVGCLVILSLSRARQTLTQPRTPCLWTMKHWILIQNPFAATNGKV